MGRPNTKGKLAIMPTTPHRPATLGANTMRPLFLLLAVLQLLGAAILISGCNKSESKSPSNATGAAKLRIAVIPKGTTHAFWKSVEAGAKAAGSELGVEVIYKGPLREDDAAGEIGLVQQFIADNVSGIVIAPLNESA